MGLRGGGPSARKHRLRGQPDGRGEQMGSASLPKEREGGGLQGSACDHEAEFRRVALVVHLSATPVRAASAVRVVHRRRGGAEPVGVRRPPLKSEKECVAWFS